MLTSKTRLTGFTLIELMVTLSVIAIITAIAAPNFSELMRQQRLTTQANNILAMLQLARSEAVNRGVRVTIQRCGDTNRAWESGWQIFTDWNGDGTLNTSAGTTDFCTNPLGNIANDCSQEKDCLIQGYPALGYGLTLRTGNIFSSSISFSPSGFTSSAYGDTFRLCDPSTTTADNEYSRAITINRIGNTKISGTASSCP